MPHKVKVTGRWAAQGRDAGGKRIQLGTFATLREAKAAEAQHARAKPQGDVTVAEWRALWLARPDWRESTRAHNAERTVAFEREHGAKRLVAINRTIARDFLVAHPSTHGALSAMFGAAMYADDEHGNALLTVNPFSKLVKRTVRRRDLQADWLGADDVRGLEAVALSTAADPRFGTVAAAMVRFAAEVGCRPGELFMVAESDLQPDEGVVSIRWAADSRTKRIERPKNGKAREVVLSTRAAEAAAAALRVGIGPPRIITDPRLTRLASVAELAPSRLVFAGPRGRQLWNSPWMYHWKSIRAAAGRPGMDFYELRHYCATRLLEAGLDYPDVAHQLGHTDGGELVRTTYGHPSRRRAMARVRDALNA